MIFREFCFTLAGVYIYLYLQNVVRGMFPDMHTAFVALISLVIGLPINIGILYVEDHIKSFYRKRREGRSNG